MNVNVATDRVQTPGSAPFEVERMGANLGAQIHGLDLKNGWDPATFKLFEAALIEHKVIYLRDQNLTTAQHVAISKPFGDLEAHPMRPQGEFPEILVLDNHKDNPVLSTDVWHSDTTFRKCPTKYTILRCQIMPKVGGDTLWADMEAAYDGLSASFKKCSTACAPCTTSRISARYSTKSEEDQARLRRMEEMYPNPSHPVVRTHPVSGRKSIFVNPQFTLRIEGLGSTRAARFSTCCSSRLMCRNISSACAGRRARSYSGTTNRRSTTPPTTTIRNAGAWSAPPWSAKSRSDGQDDIGLAKPIRLMESMHVATSNSVATA